MRRDEDPDLTIAVGSPEGGSTITPEACAEFMENSCQETCKTVGTCALANAVARQLERTSTLKPTATPPSFNEVVRLMDLNE